MSRGYLQLLKEEGDFRRVYVSQLISLGGDWFAVIPLLSLLARLTGGGLYGGLTLAVDTLFFALLVPYAGTVADRLDRRRIMVIADLASAVLVLMLLLVRSEATAFVALPAIGGVAVAKAFYSPASGAAVPNLVPREDLSKATVLSGAAWGTMLAVGAAMGGLVALAIGERWCFVIDAASFLLSAWLTARTTKPFSQPREEDHRQPSVVEDIRETVEYARADHRVLSLITCKMGVAFGNGTLALFPLFATRIYDVGSLGTGLFYSARGVGALVGPFVMRRFVARDERLLLPVLATSMMLFGISYLGFAVAPWFVLALVLVVLAHAGGGANWILSTYGLNAIVPDRVLGRVTSADYMLATLGISLSQVVAGVLSEQVSLRPLTAAFGGVVLVYAMVWRGAVRRVS